MYNIMTPSQQLTTLQYLVLHMDLFQESCEIIIGSVLGRPCSQATVNNRFEKGSVLRKKNNCRYSAPVAYSTCYSYMHMQLA
jgi:hypothetical protein